MNTETSSRPPDARHPIQVVARRTGLTPDTLRAWEKRYGAVEPDRAAGGRRLYSDADIERLLLLRRAMEAGRRIGQIAGLSSRELRQLAAQDERAIDAAPKPRVRDATSRRDSPTGRLQACLDAVARLDAGALEAELVKAQIELALPAFIDELLRPFVERLGDGWRDGEFRVAHEHLASAVVRAVLGNQTRPHGSNPFDPLVVVTTPPGQIHELGAMMAAVAANAEGRRVTYLGADLPAEEIVAAVNASHARCLALSLVYPTDDPHLPDVLRQLRKMLPDDLALLVGGRAQSAYGDVLDEIGARRLSSFREMRDELQRLRASGS